MTRRDEGTAVAGSEIAPARCRICDSPALSVFAHTARCGGCGVLLYWPSAAEAASIEGTGRMWPRDEVRDWYARSSFRNHSNFTSMVRFAIDASHTGRAFDVLDYGGGGGQFALVCKSHFPQATVYITDISDDTLLDEWQPFNRQIPFGEFPRDPTTFDFIFLNDVFEHVSHPLAVLRLLAGKLKPGGTIFIDTPKQFWLYPAMRVASSGLYTRLLKGTVSSMHLQIWTRRSFERVVGDAGLAILRYREESEYTMPASFYLRNMGIRNPILRVGAGLFYRNARWIAKNKIVCVLGRA